MKTIEDFHERYKFDPEKDKIGEGGFGIVFKAEDSYEHKPVALKMMPVPDDARRPRLSKEVQMAKDMPPHPNIARYEDCYTYTVTGVGKVDFAILRYYEDGNLEEFIKKQQPSIEAKCEILFQILKGLDFLHSQGAEIIHRDLKPANILMINTKDGYVPLITDFGISKKLDSDKSSVLPTLLAGDRAYSAPEQFDSVRIKKNLDLWCFGVMAYEVLVGELPFNTGKHSKDSQTGQDEYRRQVKVGEISERINEIAEPWQKLIRRCLVPDPMKRIQTVNQCFDLLKGKEIQPDVYVLGHEFIGQDEGFAILWKNDKALHRLSEFSFNSVFVSDDDVYVLGDDNDYNSSLWKNGILQTLDCDPLYSLLKSIFVSGDDVYVAGSEQHNVTTCYYAVIWKNGEVFYRLTDGLSIAYANSVFVSGDDVYVAGYEMEEICTDVAYGEEEFALTTSFASARVWKNGKVLYCFNDVDVSCDPYEYNPPKDCGTYPLSICVSGDDVYVAGYERKPITDSWNVENAVVWKNGKLLNHLSNGFENSRAVSVSVSDDDVYVAGYEDKPDGKRVAMVWKNGRVHYCLEDEKNSTQAMAIFVK